MSTPLSSPPAAPQGRLRALLFSAEMARAFTLTTVGVVFSTPALARLLGLAGSISVVAGLCLIGGAMLVVRREELSWPRLLPSTLVLFLLVTLASTFWSTDPGRTVLGWLALAAIAFLAVVVAHVRDTLQTVRAIGDVLRMLLGLSLALEILSGILLDVPFAFLGMQGNIAFGGPVQGIFGTRNLLGLTSVIALITFVIEWRTASVRRGVSIFSVVLAGALALLSASPTVYVLVLGVGIAAAVLALVRSTPLARRGLVQGVLAALVLAVGTVAYVLRHTIIAVLGAGSDFSTRATLWDSLLDFVGLRPLQGWGWFGPWDRNELPFYLINAAVSDRHATALNAYLDVLLQVGWVGLLVFATFCGVTLVRGWLVASERRSVIYAWTPLITVALLIESAFESFTLVGAGWFMLVLCAVRAGQSRSWRERLPARDAPTGGVPVR